MANGIFESNVVGTPAVSATGTNGTEGINGSSDGGEGVHGISFGDNAAGVAGYNLNFAGGGPGVLGEANSGGGEGVHGISHSGNAGVGGYNDSTGAGVYGTSTSGFAGYFDGNVQVNGNVQVTGHFDGDVQVTGDVILINSSGDVAEDFDLEDDPGNGSPGTVLVINSNGKLCASEEPYDTRVAGVVSGAGGLTPAVVLQRLESRRPRSPIALVGKAFCKVDASFGCITAGDLLTTSSTPGHAMKVLDHTRAFGAIIGKALSGLEDGQGLIPILVTPH